MTPPQSADIRAWLGEGPTSCTFCLHGYSLEVEVHCVFCDRPGCPHCMVRVTEVRGFGCPDCPPDEGDATAGEDD